MQNVGHVPRAPRFAVRAPVRYRRSGALAWSEGHTVNISRSGVLMSGGGRFDSGDVIEVRLALSAADPNVADVWVLGSVVRVDRAASEGPLIAAAIESYRFHGEGRLPGALRTDEDI
jgi:PilZ domain-containing protein